jgi:hypothetical protein
MQTAARSLRINLSKLRKQKLAPHQDNYVTWHLAGHFFLGASNLAGCKLAASGNFSFPLSNNQGKIQMRAAPNVAY